MLFRRFSVNYLIFFSNPFCFLIVLMSMFNSNKNLYTFKGPNFKKGFLYPFLVTVDSQTECLFLFADLGCQILILKRKTLIKFLLNYLVQQCNDLGGS